MSKRSRPKRSGVAASAPKAPRPAPPPILPPGKVQRYRLVVYDLAVSEEKTTLVEGGPLAMCEDHGMRAANYGVFRLCEGGSREWHRPTRIVIEPVKDEEVVEG